MRSLKDLTTKKGGWVQEERKLDDKTCGDCGENRLSKREKQAYYFTEKIL